MTTNRLLSLAAGVCPETSPPDFVEACAAAGWKACGIWFDPDTWTDAVAADVKRRLDHHGMIALDMEPVFVGPDGDHGERLIEAAATVGARNILVVNYGADRADFVRRFQELCQCSAQVGISCCVEFLPILSLKTLGEAVSVLAEVDQPNAGILVDSHHLHRSGATPADLANIDPAVFRYAQLNDAALDPGPDLYADAVDLRCSPGEGELPLVDVVNAIPAGTPLSMEVRSAALRRDFPNPVDRARSVLVATERFFTANATAFEN